MPCHVLFFLPENEILMDQQSNGWAGKAFYKSCVSAIQKILNPLKIGAVKLKYYQNLKKRKFFFLKVFELEYVFLLSSILQTGLVY